MPRLRLTLANVGTLRAITGRKSTEYRDTLVPGLTLRISAGGVRTWAVEYHVRVDGRRRGARLRLGSADLLTIGDARDAARAALRRRDLIRAYEGRPPLTVAELVERALAGIKLRPTTLVHWRSVARSIIGPAFGPRGTAELTRQEILSWTTTLARRSPSQARSGYEVLNRAYTWGIEQGIIENNPCAAVRKPAGPDASDRVLSTLELRALLGALREMGGMFAAIVELLLLTCVRRGSVLGARREEFHALGGPEPRWTIPGSRTKGGRDHVVPLSQQAARLVTARLAIVQGEHLFPQQRGDRDSPVRWHPERADELRELVHRHAEGLTRDHHGPARPLRRWTLHNLRHSAATHLREDLHVARDVVAMLLSHAQPGSAVTRIYDRAELLEERRAALVAWADWIDSLAGDARRHHG